VSSLGPIARRLSARTKLALVVLTAVGYHADIGPYHQMAQIYDHRSTTGWSRRPRIAPGESPDGRRAVPVRA
jgi:hypothetical protein